MALTIDNLTTKPLSLEITASHLQGHHLTFRQTIAAAARGVTAVFPAGFTPELLAGTTLYKAEQAKASPNWRFREKLSVIQATAATATSLIAGRTPLIRGIVKQVTLWAPVASAAGESWTLTQLRVAGTDILGGSLALPAATPANTKITRVLSAATYAGDLIDGAITYVAGGTPTPLANIRLEVEIEPVAT
jgi:hypothetical protein